MVPVLQACAAAYTEEQADLAQGGIAQYAQERGLYLRPRYSPGYGDLPLASQRFLFDVLQISKKIGVTLTGKLPDAPHEVHHGDCGAFPRPLPVPCGEVHGLRRGKLPLPPRNIKPNLKRRNCI